MEISFSKTIIKFEETTKVGPWEAGHMRYTRQDGYMQFDKSEIFSEAGLTEARFVLTRINLGFTVRESFRKRIYSTFNMNH